MNVNNAFDIIITGSHIRYLMTISSDSRVRDVRGSFEKISSSFVKSDFFVTQAYMDEYMNLYLKKLNRKRKDDTIGILAEKFRTSCSDMEKVFLAEAKTKHYYSLPKLRYNSSYLLESQDKFLKKDAFEKLSEIGKFDFASSCKCLLYGEGTASAFHILRVTEDTLKRVYLKHILINRLPEKQQMMGPIISELKKMVPLPINATLLDSLNLLRASYRNPTQHPVATFDIESSQDLFGLCIDVINKMTDEF